MKDIQLIVDLVTAAGTLGLAGATFWMARKTAALVAQEKQQHEDRFMPICVLQTPYEGGGTVNRQAVLSLRPPPGQPGAKHYLIHGCLKNAGAGPAVDLRLTLRFPDKGGHELFLELTPLGSGETVSPTRYDTPGEVLLRIPVAACTGFDEADIASSVNGRWELHLEYTDVFGNHYHTTHRQEPSQPWTRFAKECRPKAIAPTTQSQRGIPA
ncbi:MAG: hypothetical protein ACYDDA_13860 [Acidiferrobacteraceae bacterium]